MTPGPGLSPRLAGTLQEIRQRFLMTETGEGGDPYLIGDAIRDVLRERGFANLLECLMDLREAGARLSESIEANDGPAALGIEEVLERVVASVIYAMVYDEPDLARKEDLRFLEREFRAGWIDGDAYRATLAGIELVHTIRTDQVPR